MSKPWILLTPSSRGLGFHLCRHLLRNTTVPILATARSDPSPVKDRLLDGLPEETKSRLHMARIDVTHEPTMKETASYANDLFPKDRYHLHLGFAVPGVLFPEKNPNQVDYGHALETYKVNTLGPLMMMKHFHDFLPRKTTSLDQIPDELPPHAVWTTMSARVGSISDNRLGGWYSYRSSKAAVNALTKSFDHDLVVRSGGKAMAISYHPGTMKTDLARGYWETTPEDKLLAPEDAAEKMLGVVKGMSMEGRGRCWDYKGEEVLP